MPQTTIVDHADILVELLNVIANLMPTNKLKPIINENYTYFCLISEHHNPKQINYCY